METQNPPAKNYLYELLKKKYHTSEIIRVQIDDIREAIREKVAKEPLKSFVVKFRGRVIDNSFERTLKIISKRQFIKGEINTITTLKEQEIVESTMTATLTEVESLIHYLKKPHVVLHCKKEVAKDASNLLIIDETEQSQLGDLAPDSIHRNCITSAESREKYTGRLGNYLILNGLPLTSEKIGRELRFNRIETKNKVFTTTGLKEIYLNLHFISLILKLDLEQHYLKLRILNSQENDLQMVERKIEDLGFFADIFTHIASKDNPLLFNKDLFVDLSRVEHIVENNDWRAIPAYAGYIYSAATRLNDQFKLLEECGLFLTYANCIEKFIVKLTKKLLKHKPDIHNEQQNLTANYNELKKLQTVLKHPILQADYQELLDSFTKLLAYIDFLTIRGTGVADSGSHQEMINPAEKHHKKSDNKIKNWISSFLTGSINVSKKPVPHHDQSMKTEHEEDAQKLIIKFNEHLQKLSKLETTTGKSAFLEARMNIPLLTNLSYILDQLKELIKKVEGKKDIQDPFKAIFAKSNKFEIFYRELNDEGTIETAHEQESVHKILIDLQKLLFDKPLKESTYTEIINKVQFLENFIINKKKPTVENNSISAATILQAYQNPIFKIFADIKARLQNIIEKERQHQKIDSFKNEPIFFSYSSRELDAFLAQVVNFHEELKDTCYYKDISAFETTEKKFDRLIDEVKDIENRISSQVRSKDKQILKERNIRINYLKSSHLLRKNLEKAILVVQNQVSQIDAFIHDVESNLQHYSFVHSGVATSVLFDQITYLLSNIDVRLIDLTKETEDMFNESVSTIFHYQVGEIFQEPKAENIDDLMKEIDKRSIIRKY